MPRILVLSASVGAGHMRAAEAVELALKNLAPEAHVQNIDVLEFTNAAFRRLYSKSYFELIAKAPHVLGYVYELMDRQPSAAHKGDRLRLLVERLNLGRFLKLLRSEPWDLVVNTHFLPAEIIASLRRKGEIATPQFTATTDFETHRLWVNQPCDHYFTATDEGAAYLAWWGVPPQDISVTGIPIHPVFSQPKSQEECRRKHGIGDCKLQIANCKLQNEEETDPTQAICNEQFAMDNLQSPSSRPVVLQLAGGFGVGPVEQLFRGLLSIETPLEIVTVSGRNEELKGRLEEVARGEVAPRHRVKVLGFTSEIDELMAAADLVVSKPGGLTTSEALARGAAMVIVNPIPGQEARNSDFLLENGAAIKVNNIATLAHKMTRLLAEPERLARMKECSRRLGRPDAAFAVARRALAWIGVS